MISHLRSSVVKWLENVIEKARRNIDQVKFSYTLVAEKITGLGEIFFKYISALSNRLTMVLDKIQIGLIEPMSMAELWYGLIAVIIVCWVVCWNGRG
ncbi:MAG: hypothetical protein QW254_03265 [Desulfurococcaceae archaeon]